MIAEYDNGAAVGSPSREQIYLGGGLLARYVGSTITYYHRDHLSNRRSSNSSGTANGNFGTFPFGEAWYGGDFKWRFTSYERDAESGNDYATMRSYISRCGRFSSPDPLGGDTGDPQSLNRYSYVLNDPANSTDPLGLECQPWGLFLTTTVTYTFTYRYSDGSVFTTRYSSTTTSLLRSFYLSDEGERCTPDRGPSKECKAALAIAGQTTEALKRAKANWGILQNAGFYLGVPTSILAAIGIRETGFQNITGDKGHGHGVFQFDDRYNSANLIRNTAYDLTKAATEVATRLARSMNSYFGEFNSDESLAAAVHDHNRGAGGTIYKLRQSSPLGFGTVVTALNVGTAHWNYTSNVLDIAKHCF